MAKYVDLSLLVREPLIFQVPKGFDENDEMILEDITIPGELSNGLVLKMHKYQSDLQNIEDNEVALNKLIEVVAFILNLDKSKDIGIDYVNTYLSDIRMQKIIFEKAMTFIKEISEDENLKSPKSTSTKKKATKSK